MDAPDYYVVRTNDLLNGGAYTGRTGHYDIDGDAIYLHCQQPMSITIMILALCIILRDILRMTFW